MKTFILVFFSYYFSFSLYAETKVYELFVHKKTVNYTGTFIDHALAIRLKGQSTGKIPGPTLRFKKGDNALIKVQNDTKTPITFHWHGVLVPWNMDGPAFINNKLIHPGEVFVFQFPIIHTGTFWYHSHTNLQEQKGLYGAIVIEDEDPQYSFQHDQEIVLSDWSDELPRDILNNLKKDGDYYAYKKDFFPSLFGAIRHGLVWNFLKSEWNKMGSMDLSDIAYDLFLSNGVERLSLKKYKHGDLIRLRIINAAASSYFYLNLGMMKNFTVISKDGQKVQPILVNEILIGIGETYDLMIRMPHNGNSLELRATAQDVTGYTSVIMGDQKHIETVPDKVLPSPYISMEHDMGNMNMINYNTEVMTSMDNMMHTMMKDAKDANPISYDIKRLDIKRLKSLEPTVFPKDSMAVKNIILNLTGNMSKYQWTINDESFEENPYIDIKFNDVVRFTMINRTMMHHPMHLHGHFFRVLNGQGDYSPLFHTVDVPPMQTVVIEFLANEKGLWFFHCHNLYHMKLGMARIVRYKDFERPQDLLVEAAKYEKRMIQSTDPVFYGSLELKTDMLEFNAGVLKGKWEVDLEVEIDQYEVDEVEGKLILQKNVLKLLTILGGVEYEDAAWEGILGLGYTYPFNIESVMSIRTDKKIGLELTKEMPLYYKLDVEIMSDFKSKIKGKDLEWLLEVILNYSLSPELKIGPYYKYTLKDKNYVGFHLSILF